MNKRLEKTTQDEGLQIDTKALLIDNHFKFLHETLYHLPSETVAQESNRLLFAFFAINGIDLLKKLYLIDDNAKQNVVDWIYSLQVKSTGHEKGKFGFKGSTIVPSGCSYEVGQITMTFCALLSLIILGDDLSRVDRKAIIKGLRQLQLKDGSFEDVPEGNNDLRMIYSVACICYILQDWSVFDFTKVENIIRSCLTYEGGFGQRQGCEAHGGYTYCALGTLYLMNRINALSQSELSSIRRWCLMKQDLSSFNNGGYRGRSNKEPDSCYSFWIGASLKMIDSFAFASKNVFSFLLTCQDHEGGFGKTKDIYPDILHTFFSICGLSLLSIAQIPILPFHPALIISERAMEHLKHVQQSWNN